MVHMPSSACNAFPAQTSDLLGACMASLPSCSPEDTYSWISGATACLRCVNGLPEECTGGVCPSDAEFGGNIQKSSPGEPRWLHSSEQAGFVRGEGWLASTICRLCCPEAAQAERATRVLKQCKPSLPTEEGSPPIRSQPPPVPFVLQPPTWCGLVS